MPAISNPPQELVLPRSFQVLLGRVPPGERHPGLQLDKYSRGGEQTQQKEALREVVTIGGHSSLFAELRQRREAMLQALGVRRWGRRTAGPLTLHLARASALENAGLCLHPVYGFAYLPGTGLKGMARAYAETVWLPAHGDGHKIEQVFGRAPAADADQDDERAAAGSVVFHDAWPSSWPRLLVDIVNNHHSSYYQGEEPPGDWESPVPVYFLAVAPGQEFSFALGTRRGSVSDELVELAQQWLDGALTLLGCGAKTVAGYGYFQAESMPSMQERAVCEATLELTAPAFLAGANQEEADCDLRPATLRGLLRWWWRTLHAGFVETDTLRRMEAVVWGDTSASGAVSLTLEPLGPMRPERCPFKAAGRSRDGREVLTRNEAFLGQHGIPLSRGRTTQGLLYHAFGMDEIVGKPTKRKQRCYLPAGTRWRLRLMARAGSIPVKEDKTAVLRPLSADVLLTQARLALWWLCHLGGAGSKARKGFGSFADCPELADFPGGRWRTQGQAFRTACGLGATEFNPEWADSPALYLMCELSRQVLGPDSPWLEVSLPAAVDPWFVLDRMGTSAQRFAQADTATRHGKHCREKLGLGLPRKIHRAPGEDLRGVRGDRFSSPVWYHLGRSEAGQMAVRVSAFPARQLRLASVSPEEGLRQHQQLLAQLLPHLRDDLLRALGETAPDRPNRPPRR
jgi:CRISPR-associated protein Cmr6